ncbi:MAG: thiamine pyrophosphate-binding protein [Candidatus Tectomicrobia bacterium]|uniref:Thiamine pyrophosphate-binding protein n=1 Tax=Tectimicrobiota bacterium TaxID=2528274 RepID=A0A932M0N5_UNCTE|nr:thiamine pyrophosphate-binding protein [Candidatus Tectomicrobia bacterium]
MPSGAQLFVECLKALGVTHVFSLPGTGIMILLEALEHAPEIRCITVRHEQLASHMADGYARTSGKPGVVLASRGPGAANTLVGLTCAYPACSPVVVIAGQTPTRWLGREAFEEFDLVAMFRPVTKHAFQAQRASTFPEVLRRAFWEASSGRPGPTFLSVPSDLFQEEVEASISPVPLSIPPRLRPDPGPITRALDLLLEARFPVMLLGGGVNISGAASEAVTLAERLGLAVVPSSEPDVFPTHHPLFVNDRQVVKEADVVLAVGCRFSELGTFGWTLLPGNARLIHIDIDPFQIDKVYTAEVGIIADAKAALTDLLEAVSAARLQAAASQRIEERRNQVRMRHEDFQRRRWPKEGWDSGPITPWRFLRDLQEVLPGDALIASNAATLGHWLNRCYDFGTPGTLLYSVGGATGFGLPAAAGAKLALPERTVVCLCGDGAFTMVEGTLSTLVHDRIPLFTMVWNNSAFLQTALHVPTVSGNYLKNPDFVTIARAYGISGRRVEHPGQIKEALVWGLKETREGRPSVVEVIATSDLNEATPARYFRLGRGGGN